MVITPQKKCWQTVKSCYYVFLGETKDDQLFGSTREDWNVSTSTDGDFLFNYTSNEEEAHKNVTSAASLGNQIAFHGIHVILEKTVMNQKQTYCVWKLQ